jgi:ankyrin repeat protein
MTNADLNDWFPSRREVVAGLLLSSAATTTCAKRGYANDGVMTDALWQQWQADWRKMEGIAKTNGWELMPLQFEAPLTNAQVTKHEKKNGRPFPPQLREVLTKYAASVRFDWRVAQHLRPMERVEHLYPTSGGIRDHIWDVDMIGDYALPNFEGWKRDLENKDLSEAFNAPEMWANQFAIGNLPNGDMLTIDVSNPSGPQPVRYFSHDVEGLHGHILAPDFFSFISTYSALGCAGSTHDDWFRFIEKRDDAARVSLLSATGAGAQTWLAWRDGGLNERHTDDPQPAVLGTTAADRALLTAAYENSQTGVMAAIAAGASIDCIWNSDWGDNPVFFYETEFWTALTHAVRHNNLALVDILLQRGATLNTRHLPLDTAVEQSTLGTVKGLIERGARVDGWRHQRHWPLHLLVTRRGPAAAFTREEYRKNIEKSESQSLSYYDDLIANTPDGETREMFRKMKADAETPEAAREREKQINRRLALHVDGAEYDAMLDGLLKAGATPDAPWDNGITMLMEGGAVTAATLLKHGASVAARDAHGRTPLHWAHNPEKAKILVAAGADINAYATPDPNDTQSSSYTPLQLILLLSRDEDLAVAKALLELGADPKLKDKSGYSTLAYCVNAGTFKLIQSYGLDPKELQPGGRTLLHNLAVKTSPPRVSFASEVAFLKHLLSLGLDINTQDEAGQTLLHLAAARASYDGSAPDFELLIAHGADKSIKDKAGKRAFDLAAKSLEAIRSVLQ